MEIGTQDIRPVRSQDKATSKEAASSPQEEPKDCLLPLDNRNLYKQLPPFYL
jgi:hypothetical protein